MFAHLNPRRLFYCGCVGAAVCWQCLPLDFSLFIASVLLAFLYHNQNDSEWNPAAIAFGSVADVRFLLIFQNLYCWLCFGLIPAVSVNTTVHPIVFCTAVSFYFYVENPYICRWVCFWLIPALSVNTTVHSVVCIAAGSYDRHRHIYRYFDFTPATGTAWFYINRKKL